MENTITIPLRAYEELIRANEKLRAVERLCKRTNYADMNDVKAILDIEVVKEQKNETV